MLDYYIKEGLWIVTLQYFLVAGLNIVLYGKWVKGFIRKKQFLLSLLISFILSILYGVIGLFVNIGMLVYLSLLNYSCRRSLLASLFISSTTMNIFILSDYIVEILFHNVSFTNNYYLASVVHILLVFFTMCILVIGLTFLGRLLKQHIVMEERIYIEFILGIVSLFLFIVLFFDILFQRALGEEYLIEKINAVFFLAYTVISFFIFMGILHLVKKKMELENQKKYAEDLKHYLSDLEQNYEEIRKFRHDYKNVLISIEAYLFEDDLAGLKKYYLESLKETDISQSIVQLSDLKNVKNMIVKSIFASKLTLAQNKGLTTSFEAKDEIIDVQVDPIILSRILGIILDNAIEAAIESIDKAIRAAIYETEQSVFIIVINSHGDFKNPISLMEKNGFSTKGENRGIGLSNLRDIVEQFPNLYLDTRIEENVFIQKIEIRGRETLL